MKTTLAILFCSVLCASAQVKVNQFTTNVVGRPIFGDVVFRNVITATNANLDSPIVTGRINMDGGAGNIYVGTNGDNLKLEVANGVAQVDANSGFELESGTIAYGNGSGMTNSAGGNITGNVVFTGADMYFTNAVNNTYFRYNLASNTITLVSNSIAKVSIGGTNGHMTAVSLTNSGSLGVGTGFQVNSVGIVIGASDNGRINANGMEVGSGLAYSFSSSSGAGGTADAFLERAGSGTLKARTNLVSVGSITATNGFILPISTSYITFQGVTASNPPTAGAGTAYIFSATNADTAEIFTMDGAGNVTIQSPHAGDAPASLTDDTDEMPLVSKEVNIYTGTARWVNQSRSARRVEQLLNAVQVLVSLVNTNGLTAQQILRLQRIATLTPAEKDIVSVVTNYVPKVSWTAVQNQIQADYATVYTNSFNAYLEAINAGDTNAIAPTWSPPPVQPIPARLQIRGVQ